MNARVGRFALVASVAALCATASAADTKKYPLGVAVSGLVAKVLVADGAHVEAGQALLQMDCRPLEADRAVRQAEAAAAEANYDRVKNGPRPDEIAIGEANVGVAQARAEEAADAYARLRALTEGVSVTRAQLLEGRREARVTAGTSLAFRASTGESRGADVPAPTPPLPRANRQAQPALDAALPPREAPHMSRRQPPFEITPDLLLRAYSIGLFPMAEDRDSQHLHWVEPERRGVFPLDRLIVSKSLAKTVRSDVYEVTADGAFREVMQACAAREKTWINEEILRLYGELYARGHAHSVEARRDGELVGGLYGVSLGAAFFGESMFHRARDASKVALVHLVARLKLGGFRLLDTQFLTDHLASLGAIEISRAEYRRRLNAALSGMGNFQAFPSSAPMPGARALDLLREAA